MLRAVEETLDLVPQPSEPNLLKRVAECIIDPAKRSLISFGIDPVQGITITFNQKIHALSDLFDQSDGLRRLNLDAALLAHYVQYIGSTLKQDQHCLHDCELEPETEEAIIAHKEPNKALLYALYSYSVHALSHGINNILRGNQHYLKKQAIHVQTEQKGIKNGFSVFKEGRKWKLIYGDQIGDEAKQSSAFEDDLIDKTELSHFLKSFRGLLELSPEDIESIKSFLSREIRPEKLPGYIDAEQLKLAAIDILSTIFVAGSGLHGYVAENRESKYTEQKYAVRMIKWKKSELPLIWRIGSNFLLHEKSFISLSLGGMHFKKNVRHENDVHVLLYFDKPQGMDISSFSGHPQECEILLPPGHIINYTVVGKTKNYILANAEIVEEKEQIIYKYRKFITDLLEHLMEKYLNKPYADYERYEEFKSDCKLENEEGEVIWRNNHGSVHSMAQIVMGFTVIRFLSHYSKNKLFKKFCSSLLNSKKSDTMKEIIVLLGCLSIGRESELSGLKNPTEYEQYRTQSAERFHDVFIQFFKDSNRGKRKHRLNTYKKINKQLGKFYGKKRFPIQVMNIVLIAHLMHVFRCLPRKESLELLTFRLSPLLNKAGLQLIDKLALYAMTCIKLTGDRLRKSKGDQSEEIKWLHENFHDITPDEAYHYNLQQFFRCSKDMPHCFDQLTLADKMLFQKEGLSLQEKNIRTILAKQALIKENVLKDIKLSNDPKKFLLDFAKHRELISRKDIVYLYFFAHDIYIDIELIYKSECSDFIDYFIEIGSDINAAEEETGLTVLMHEMKQSLPEEEEPDYIISLLEQKNIDLSAKCKENRTIVFYFNCYSHSYSRNIYFIKSIFENLIEKFVNNIKIKQTTDSINQISALLSSALFKGYADRTTVNNLIDSLGINIFTMISVIIFKNEEEIYLFVSKINITYQDFHHKVRGKNILDKLIDLIDINKFSEMITEETLITLIKNHNIFSSKCAINFFSDVLKIIDPSLREKIDSNILSKFKKSLPKDDVYLQSSSSFSIFHPPAPSESSSTPVPEYSIR